MRVITFSSIKKFIDQHPDSDVALREWFIKTKKSEWSSLHELRKTFNHVDYVGNDRYVFNIKGNQFRLVAMIIFKFNKVYVRFIGSHEDYNKIDCKNI